MSASPSVSVTQAGLDALFADVGAELIRRRHVEIEQSLRMTQIEREAEQMRELLARSRT